MSGRIHNEGFRSKLMSARDAAALVRNGWNIGFSGFTGVGYPKEFPKALAARIEAAHEKGEEFRISMWTGASIAPKLDGALARTGGVAFRAPYRSDPEMRTAINKGITNYYDIHLSHMGLQMSQDFLGPLHLAVVEATAIAEDGDIVPSSSAGLNHIYLEQADKAIIETNSQQSEGLSGMHDVYYPIGVLPPNRGTLPVTSTGNRTSDKVLKVDADKVVAVVETNATDRNTPFKPLDDDSRAIVGYLLDFLTNEVEHGRLPENLLPLQSGVGNIANAVLAGLLEDPLENLTSYTKVIQDGMVDLIDAGKVTVASGTAFSLSPEVAERMNEKARFYRDHIILCPIDVSNHPGVIRRMGVITCNGMIEADIHGNANSTRVMDSRMTNGVGGSGDFTCNGHFSSLVTPSTAKDGAISTIVPVVSHIDRTGHDVDVIIIEQGLADLRDLTPCQRTQAIIENCVHPDFKEPPCKYVKLAAMKASGQQTPHDLATALNWHVCFLETGFMK